MAQAKPRPQRIGTPLTLTSLYELGYIHNEIAPVPSQQGLIPGFSFQVMQTNGYTLRKPNPVGKVFFEDVIHLIQSDSKKRNSIDAKKISRKDLELKWQADVFINNENPGSVEPLHRQFCQFGYLPSHGLPNMSSYYSKSLFYDPNGQEIESLTYETSLKIYKYGSRIKGKAGRLVINKKFEFPITSYWLLFKVTPYGGGDEIPEKTFSVFEDSGIIRPNQKFVYEGKETFPAKDGPLTVHTIARIGTGILPVRYMVDEEFRLLAVVSSALIYVHDAIAAEPLPDEMLQQIDRLRKRT